MKLHTIVWVALLTLASSAQAQRFTVVTPDADGHGVVSVSDPDQLVRTLGRPEIQFDLAASHDSLLDLRIRRANLKLPNGQPATAFAAHADSGLVIVAGAPVAHITISGVSKAGDSREALVLFRAEDGTLLAPPRDDIAVFRTDFSRLSFEYSPASIPKYAMLPVTLLLDVSGSMTGHIKDVTDAAERFVSSLPMLARCRIVLFNDQVQQFWPPSGHASGCAAAGFAFLKALPEPSGGTALLAAIEDSLRAPPSFSVPHLPAITLAITDGVDTGARDSASEARRLATLKSTSGSKLFVFWIGQSDPALLTGIADLQIESGVDVKDELERFFRSLGVSLSGLQSLRVEGN